MNDIRQELIGLTSRLISFQTEADKRDEVARCIAFMCDYFNGTCLSLERFECNGVKSLLVSTSKSKQPRLLLSGHIDVVKGKPAQYQAKLKGNKLYGRGAIDMKGSVAVMMCIMQQLQGTNGIAALFTSDEEIGGENGANYVLSQGIRPNFTIVAEESDFTISVSQKGGFRLEITATGKKAHSAIPEQGDNAIVKLIDVFNQFQNSLKGRRAFRPTVNLATLSGGISPQFVPDVATASLDIRVTNQSEYSIVQQLVEQINARPDCQITITSSMSFMELGSCEAEIKQLQQASKTITGINPRKIKTPYASDGRYLTERGLPVVEFGPTGAGFHGDEEYVDINRLVLYYRTLEKFIGGLS